MAAVLAIAAVWMICLWSSCHGSKFPTVEYIPQHNRFATLDITSANVPIGRKWTSACAQSLARSSSGGSSQKVTTSSSPYVLLFGGTAATTLGDTWLYDVAGNSWWQWPAIKNVMDPLPAPSARFGHTCTAAATAGGVMQFAALFGGRNAQSFNDVWVFSAAELLWMLVSPDAVSGNVPIPRWLHTTIFVSQDVTTSSYQFLVFGGNTDWNGTHHMSDILYLNDLWLLKVSTASSNFTAEWTELEASGADSSRPAQRGSHVAVWASNRQSMIIVGGHGEKGFVDIWECRYVEGSPVKWTRLTPDFPGQHYPGIGYEEQTAGYWEAKSCVVIFGGRRIAQDEALWTFCIDSKSAGIWLPIDTSPSLFVPPSMTDLSSVVIGLRMYLFGGDQDYQELALDRPWSLYVDETVTEGVWFHLAPPSVKPQPRRSQTAVAAGNTSMVVYGGVTTDISWPTFALLPNDVWMLNVTAERWTRYGEENATEGFDIPLRRAAHTAVVNDGWMWVFAGVTVDLYDILLLNDLWQWSLVTHTWKRYDHDSVLAPAGRRSHTAVTTSTAMLVFGGIANVSGDALDDLWEFSYGSAVWTMVQFKQSWPSPRFGHTAVTIDNNMVVFGGVNLGDRQPDPSVWLYNTSTKVWSRLIDSAPVSMAVPYFHAACSYGNKMIISGGCRISQDIWDRTIGSLDSMSCLPEYRLNFTESVWVFDALTKTWDRLVLEESLTNRIMHTGIMLGSVFTVYGGYSRDPLHPPVRELAAMRPGCNVGQHSKSFRSIPCRPCSEGMYSGHPGSSSCTFCPGQTTTAQGAAATSILNCTGCQAPGCHGNGECSVSLPSGTAVCRCQFGYMSSDMCQTPVYYYLIFFAIFGVLILVLGTVLLVRLYHVVEMQKVRARKLRTSRCELARLAAAWCIEESELTIQRPIDSDSPGSFGRVKLAEYREMPVAIKHLHAHISSPRNQQEFEAEVQFMRTLRHPNIVLFLGGGRFSKTSSIGPGGVSFLVMEYMARGTLSSLLRNKEEHIDSCQSLRFALDAAKGMRFLHGRNPPCIHRDLKSSNLLVSERWVVKVADFGEACPLFSLHKKEKPGRSKKRKSKGASPRSINVPSYSSAAAGLDVSVDIQHILLCTALLLSASMGDDERSALLREGSCELSSDVGTPMWQAPEMLRGQPYGPSADVYSFAIVLWEIVTRKTPYLELPSIASIVRHVLAGNRPMIPVDCPQEYADLMRKCWGDDGTRRPTFRDIVDNLDHQLESWSPQ